MRVTFLGATHEVTGSSTMLTVNGKNLLIDCGLEQGPDIFENCESPVAPAQIDAVILTHAHIDHSGKIPFLVKNGLSCPIYATIETKNLCEIMLLDSAHIQEFEAKWRNKRAKRSGEDGYQPLYTTADVEKTLTLFNGQSYNQEITVLDGVSITFYDAGHLLGSSSVLVNMTENGEKRSILFSGDLGNPPRPLIKPTAIPPKADYVVVECTYGDREHQKTQDGLDKLVEVIQTTFDRGGNVVIPSFAVGRTQELLYLLRIIKERKLIKNHANFPVYLDSPLSTSATLIYNNAKREFLNGDALTLIDNGINPISFPNLKLVKTDIESKEINVDKTPKIIISASGMCEAGRIRHHLKHNLWRQENTILFVGYQTYGTLGRRLLDGAERVRLFGEDITVNASIQKLEGASSHADKNMLIDWLKNVQAKQIFINHGENLTCDKFSDLVSKTFRVKAIAPYSGDVFNLLDGAYVKKAIVKQVSKKINAHKRARAVYDDLYTAGQNLMHVIEQNKGGTNKELAKFSAQIKALCEKYKRK